MRVPVRGGEGARRRGPALAPRLLHPSLSGLWAAAEGGLGITARTTVAMPKTLSVLDPVASGLPVLPSVSLALHHAEAEPSPAVARLTDILLETIREQID